MIITKLEMLYTKNRSAHLKKITERLNQAIQAIFKD